MNYFNNIYSQCSAFAYEAYTSATIYATLYASPFKSAKEITNLAESGSAEPVETRRIIDLAQILCQPSLWQTLLKVPFLVRTVHVIQDPELMKKCLLNTNSTDPYPTLIDTELGGHSNMLLCDNPKDHSRLRRPFQHLFALNAVQKLQSGCHLNTHLISEEDIMGEMEKTSTFSAQEKRSTQLLVQNAQTFTLSSIQPFIDELILRESEYVEKILEAWKNSPMYSRFSGSSLCTTIVEVFPEGGEATFTKLRDMDDNKRRLDSFIYGGQWEETGEIQLPCHLLRAFVFEALRLYPPIPHIPRLVKTEFQINDKVTAHPGDILMVNTMGNHRDPRYWASGPQFNPKNFLREDGTFNKEAEKKLFTFGFGVHECLGKHLAIKKLLEYTLSIIATEELKAPATKGPLRHTLKGPLLKHLS